MSWDGVTAEGFQGREEVPPGKGPSGGSEPASMYLGSPSAQRCAQRNVGLVHPVEELPPLPAASLGHLSIVCPNPSCKSLFLQFPMHKSCLWNLPRVALPWLEGLPSLLLLYFLKASRPPTWLPFLNSTTWFSLTCIWDFRYISLYFNTLFICLACSRWNCPSPTLEDDCKD